ETGTVGRVCEPAWSPHHRWGLIKLQVIARQTVSGSGFGIRSPSRLPDAVPDPVCLPLRTLRFEPVMVASVQLEPAGSHARNSELAVVVFEPDVEGVAGAVRLWSDR
ncbi:MAG: hypothetical protein ABFS37_12005, partial [Acidobacteriota bacterium]